jgi:hypothetical protein
LFFFRQASHRSLVPGEEHFIVVDIPPAVPGGIDALFAAAHLHTLQALVVCEVAFHYETCVEICAFVFCLLLLFSYVFIHW